MPEFWSIILINPPNEILWNLNKFLEFDHFYNISSYHPNFIMWFVYYHRSKILVWNLGMNVSLGLYWISGNWIIPFRSGLIIVCCWGEMLSKHCESSVLIKLCVAYLGSWSSSSWFLWLELNWLRSWWCSCWCPSCFIISSVSSPSPPGRYRRCNPSNPL